MGCCNAAVTACWRLFDANPVLAALLYLLFWPFLELAFFFRVRRFIRLRSAQPLAHHAADTLEAQRFWPFALEEENVEQTLRGWFIGDGEVRLGNVMELVAWTISAKPVAELSHEHSRIANGILEQVMAAVPPGAFPEGYNPQQRCMTHTCEPLAPCWKPLFFYLVHSLVRALTSCVLRWSGFELRREDGAQLEYWCHPGRRGRCAGNGWACTWYWWPTPGWYWWRGHEEEPEAGATLPLVVLHGVGGLVPYVPLLLLLRRMRPAGPLLVPLLPHCALHTPAFEPPLPLDTTILVADLEAVVRRHAATAAGPAAAGPTAAAGPPRAAFLAHSLGTAIFASFVKAHPLHVAASVLVDPICFLLYRRDIVFNFLYRQPKPLSHLCSFLDHSLPGAGVHHAAHLGYWFRLALHYMLTQEPSIQSCFRREFWWGRHWLHPSDLPSDSLVVLSGRDAIVPSEQVHAYLASHEAKAAAEAEAAVMLGGDDLTATGGAGRRRRRRRHLELEVHARAHHGYLMANPFAQRRLIVQLGNLMDEAAASPLAEVFPIGSSAETSPCAAACVEPRASRTPSPRVSPRDDKHVTHRR